MPDWLNQAFEEDIHHGAGTIGARLLAALAFGWVIAMVYRYTHGRAAAQSASLMATLVMLAILVSMTTMVIGSNMARAFSLAGTLAIVRFRTVVEDTRDSAFVIFAVTVGMALGAGYVLIAVIATPIAAAGAFMFYANERRASLAAVGSMPADFEVVVRIGAGNDGDGALRAALAPLVLSSRLKSIGTARQGAAVETAMLVRLAREDAAGEVVNVLNRLPGVQNVELRRV